MTGFEIHGSLDGITLRYDGVKVGEYRTQSNLCRALSLAKEANRMLSDCLAFRSATQTPNTGEGA